MQNFNFLQENVFWRGAYAAVFEALFLTLSAFRAHCCFHSAPFFIFSLVALFAHLHRAAIFNVSKSIKPFVVVPVGCRVHYVKVEVVVVDVVVAEVDVVAVAVAEIVLKSLKSLEVGQSS